MVAVPDAAIVVAPDTAPVLETVKAVLAIENVSSESPIVIVSASRPRATRPADQSSPPGCPALVEQTLAPLARGPLLVA